VTLRGELDVVWERLKTKGDVDLTTADRASFIAIARTTTKGEHAGEPVIRFLSIGEQEYARAYPCCWGHYHNCHGTRIGMYCTALDRHLWG